jgi:hypothetical protein
LLIARENSNSLNVLLRHRIQNKGSATTAQDVVEHRWKSLSNSV